MSEFINHIDTTGIGIHTGVLASFSEKNLHIEYKRWDLPVTTAARNIALVSYEYLDERGVHPVEAFVVRQHQLELQKKRTVVSSALNDLIFESLLDKEGEEIDWETVQAAQTQHDAQYHSDVVYPGRTHHLAHNVQHLAMVQGKLLKAMLDADRIALREHYITALIFGVKSLTALNVRLPATTGSPRIWGDIVR